MRRLTGAHSSKQVDSILGTYTEDLAQTHDTHAKTGARTAAKPIRWKRLLLIGVLALTIICASIYAGVVASEHLANPLETEPTSTTAADTELDRALGDMIDSAVRSRGVAVSQPSSDTSVSTSVRLDVPYVAQLPDLYSGCEITAATSALDYYGYDVSNTELNEYLEQGWSNWNPNESFVGICTGEGWMVYPTPIVDVLNTFVADKGGTQIATDISGATPEELYAYVAQGIPVIVWVTVYLQDREVAATWYVDDEEYTASQQDHCMVLMGYDGDDVILMDPFDGESVYSKEEFESSYDQRERHAVVIFASSDQMNAGSSSAGSSTTTGSSTTATQ